MPMNDVEQIRNAIVAHSRWKSRLRQAIDSGKSDFKDEMVRPDNVCEFGKWLHARPAMEKTTERWKKVRDLHSQFHQEAARVLVLALAGRKAEAEAAFALGSPFSKISADLTMVMVAWRDSIPGH
jgi:hypothetical protein